MNYYYRNTISDFLQSSTDEIIGSITLSNEFDVTFLQNKSWEQQMPILKNALQDFEGEIFFEFSIPRMGKRIDTLLVIKNVVFVIEFVTGVPGAGKTLVGLNVATSHPDNENGSASVYLSGNKPLVDILKEALVRDNVQRERNKGNKITKKIAQREIKTFIQIIHHYRDHYLNNPEAPPEHVAIFDEAQRAWNKEQTVKFMKQKKNIPNFDYSEPEFLISCLDRHKDWAVIICLVGGGQEINTGEAGISEWLDAMDKTFPNWKVYISPHLTDSEYVAEKAIGKLKDRISFDENLHLSVSMRSFRAEKLSSFVKNILDIEIEKAKENFLQISDKYPIVLTRDIVKAKQWLKEKARGSERYGIIVSSKALRLRPFGIDVTYQLQMDPVKWFLNDKNDIHSSFYLEDATTEYKVQGLELDWSCVVWDGDLRYSPDGWKTFSFAGNKWQHIYSPERKKYLANAYRVLLTRARQGMIIVIPEGNEEDHTRPREYYDVTYNYLKILGIKEI